MFDLNDLYQAYLDCRKHKRNTANALAFEMDLEKNLLILYRDLKNETYQIGKSICFAVDVPKVREIWAADFRDRVVHHLLYNAIRERFENDFITDSFACIRGRGSLRACHRLEQQTRRVSCNYQEPAWFLKADIQNFFVSIDKNILHAILLRKIDEPWILRLLQKILFHDPKSNCFLKGNKAILAKVPKHKSLWHSPADKGLPIGNLTSQFFSNVYLNELDQFVKHQLKCRHYTRYVDDLVILHSEPKYLSQIYESMNQFLGKELHLSFHPKKTQIQKLENGINFVGFIVKPYRKYIRRSSVGRLKDKIRKWKSAPASVTEESWMQYRAMLNSYYGLFRWANGYRLRLSLAKEARNERVFPDGDLSKFYLKPLNSGEYFLRLSSRPPCSICLSP
jgi:retron-type reverse transcriptase